MSFQRSSNRNWYGYAPATNNQIIGGSAPFVYNNRPGDSLTCIANKTAYNQAHASVFSPDTIVRSHPASALIQGSTMNMHENAIKNSCYPSFKHDGPPPNAAKDFLERMFA